MSEKQPCKCCGPKKTCTIITATGYGYNRLEGEPREWAKNNRCARSEFCVPVRGGKKFRGPEWVKTKCGDGRMGFSTRRKNRDEVNIEVGLDGQFQKKRGTLVRQKSARATASRRPRRVDGGKCGLVSSVEIKVAARDPIVVAHQRKVSRKSKRARNRNNAARRVHQRAMRMTQKT